MVPLMQFQGVDPNTKLQRSGGQLLTAMQAMQSMVADPTAFTAYVAGIRHGNQPALWHRGGRLALGCDGEDDILGSPAAWGDRISCLGAAGLRVQCP